jgi:nitroreductase
LPEFFEVLRARRSVRDYTDQVPDEEQIRQVLEAGLEAPSGFNLQPWEFVVIQHDQALREAIADITLISDLRGNVHKQRWILRAPVWIIVLCNPKWTTGRYGGEWAQRINNQDISAAIENMLLAATALGLGTCWMGGFDEPALCELLHLPENIYPVALLTVGYPAGPTRRPFRVPLKNKLRATY